MDTFQQRRAWLEQQLDSDSVVILVGNTAKTRSKNIKYHFRADNDLYYMTGFTEPDAVAVLRPGHPQAFVLFVRPNDAAAETSFGTRAGLPGAKTLFNADQSYAIDDLERELPELLMGRSKVYYHDEQGIYSDRIIDWLNQQRRSTGFDIIKEYRQLLPLAPILHNKRVFKSKEEIILIRRAVKASSVAHKKVMASIKPGMNERQLSAIFDREIAEYDCFEVCYPSIVASGNNACCLHYEDNNCTVRDGQMLLIDAGAEYRFYCSDITRSYPVNGRFSKEQARLYQLVLDALDAAIAKVEPGLSWDVIYQTCMQVMAKGLIELGLLSGSLEQVMADESYREFTVHKTGHWLGMDVHDVGAYHDKDGNWLSLQPNMVFTIEPGIYIPEHCQTVDEKWRGIGIRIEDDILVTASGHENLSRAIPRSVKEIESFMAASQTGLN